MLMLNPDGTLVKVKPRKSPVLDEARVREIESSRSSSSDFRSMLARLVSFDLGVFATPYTRFHI